MLCEGVECSVGVLSVVWGCLVWHQGVECSVGKLSSVGVLSVALEC